ncbi:hypothetical protein GCM10025760_19030 [Microbacterium yannicii]|uniref:Uncharacterized protein n=1 Tax=Microbacterium yannicii TaxID=671622 RepID=A0ABP9MAR1_9MICO|nr:hypothetical protein [Microbacterium yannicii]MCO5951468.1 hypothetical protein [Microbacterium yannicii]
MTDSIADEGVAQKPASEASTPDGARAAERTAPPMTPRPRSGVAAAASDRRRHEYPWYGPLPADRHE